ncbi:MAG: HAD family hydrolase [Halobacteriales archaeon]
MHQPLADAEAVVFDLDGTLVRLAVDWSAVAGELRALLADAGVDADGWSVWECYDRARDRGLEDAVESVLAEHEIAGAEAADRLPAADLVAELACPVGVCSLNAERACRTALQRHGLDNAVEAVVGRDTVDAVKPDPAPLLAALGILGAEPAAAVFIGDGSRDEETARRAGVPFAYVDAVAP